MNEFEYKTLIEQRKMATLELHEYFKKVREYELNSKKPLSKKNH